jgi:hypothetical protein
MQQYTIHPLVVGINETDQGVMTYLRDYGKRIYLPIYIFYLKGGDKHILVDTGLEQFMVPEGAEKECGFKILEFEEGMPRSMYRKLSTNFCKTLIRLTTAIIRTSSMMFRWSKSMVMRI